MYFSTIKRCKYEKNCESTVCSIASRNDGVRDGRLYTLTNLFILKSILRICSLLCISVYIFILICFFVYYGIHLLIKFTISVHIIKTFFFFKNVALKLMPHCLLIGSLSPRNKFIRV